MHNEYLHTKCTLLDLEKYSIKFDQIANESIFQSKKQFLITIETEIDKLKNPYEIQKDEFNSINNQYMQLKKQKDHLELHNNEIKEKQRILFRETNEITKMIDELESQSQTYQDKLLNLDPKKDSEDFQRLQTKLQPFKEKIEQLKGQRLAKIQESKHIKEILLKNDSEINQIQKKISEIQPKYNEIHKNFEEIEKKFENLKKERDQIKKEIDDIVRNSPDNSQNLDFHDDNSFGFSSKNQINEEIQKKKDTILFLYQKLSQILATTDETKFESILKEKFSNTEQKLKELCKQKNEFDQHEISLIKYLGFFQDLKEFQIHFNKILKPLNLTIQSTIKFLPETIEELPIQTEMYLHTQKIDIENDLKRFDKAYVYFAFIFSAYLTLNQTTIPIYIDDIPENMSTKQTFQKSITQILEYMKDSFNESSIQILFFIKNRSFDEISVVNID